MNPPAQVRFETTVLHTQFYQLHAERVESYEKVLK
jgi:hypothetical protein